jgi:hypothetical protein
MDLSRSRKTGAVYCQPAHAAGYLILYTSYADYAFYGTPPIKAMNLVPGFNATSTLNGRRIKLH